MKAPPGMLKGIIIASILLIVGAGLYATASYSLNATDQPSFCSSCHIMHEVTRTQQASVHASLSCNECHAPKAGLRKIFFKAKAGAWDFYQNTIGTVDDVISATEATKSVINENCKSCHVMSVVNMMEDAKESCTDCHRQVPHSSKSPIAQRRAANE